MPSLFHIPRQPLSRRTFLRGAGFALALPMLESMRPLFGSAARAAAAEAAVPRRMVAIETNQGIMPQFFFPEKTGADYTPPAYLEKLAAHRKNMTVFSGVSLPGVTGGHAAERCFLTGTPHPERGGFRNGISLDQLAAEQFGNRTRFPSLTLAMTNEGGPTLSFTRTGAPIAPEKSPRKLFEKLFVQGKPDEVKANIESLKQGQSMLDFVADQRQRLEKTLPNGDKQRLDQFFNSVRELEQRLHGAEAWEYKPKPVVKAKAPEENNDSREFVARTRNTMDVVKLALETDSSRLVTLFIDTTVIHNLTHHGNRPEVIAELRGHEERQFDALNRFLTQLTETSEEGQTLLDRTMVLYGTCMGSANAHSNVNLPVLLAGGGFKHGQHLGFNKENNYPLSNLYVSMLQRLGIETSEFSTGKTTMQGLERA